MPAPITAQAAPTMPAHSVRSRLIPPPGGLGNRVGATAWKMPIPTAKNTIVQMSTVLLCGGFSSGLLMVLSQTTLRHRTGKLCGVGARVGVDSGQPSRPNVRSNIWLAPPFRPGGLYSFRSANSRSFRARLEDLTQHVRPGRYSLQFQVTQAVGVGHHDRAEVLPVLDQQLHLLAGDAVGDGVPEAVGAELLAVHADHLHA